MSVIDDDIEKYRKEETRKHNILKKEEAKNLLMHL
jgi:hypothetical protein